MPAIARFVFATLLAGTVDAAPGAGNVIQTWALPDRVNGVIERRSPIE